MDRSEQDHIFEKWLKKYKSLLIKVVRVYALTTYDQDDLLQDIAIQIWRSIPSFRQESAVSTWLYRIAINTALKWIRKEQKHRHQPFPYENVDHIIQIDESAIDEKLIWLYQEIAKLNEVDRSITLLLLDGFNYREMSDILGITENNVGVKIHRIKNHLINKSKHYEVNYHGI